MIKGMFSKISEIISRNPRQVTNTHGIGFQPIICFIQLLLSVVLNKTVLKRRLLLIVVDQEEYAIVHTKLQFLITNHFIGAIITILYVNEDLSTLSRFISKYVVRLRTIASYSKKATLLPSKCDFTRSFLLFQLHSTENFDLFNYKMMKTWW